MGVVAGEASLTRLVDLRVTAGGLDCGAELRDWRCCNVLEAPKVNCCCCCCG